jgi:hypothetical protein
MFVGFLAISQIDKINESSLELKEKWLPKVQLVMDMKVNLTRFSEQQLMHVLAHDEASWRIHEAKMQEIAADDRKAYEKYAR